MLLDNVFIKIVMHLYKRKGYTDNSDEIVKAIGGDEQEVRSALTIAKNINFITKIEGETRNPIWELTKDGIELGWILDQPS